MTRRKVGQPKSRGVAQAKPRAVSRAKPRDTRPVLPRPRAPRWLTPARQRELVGALLLALGVVTGLALATGGGALTRSWLAALRWALGWAALLAPLAFGALGAWLIVDSLDGRGDVRWERPVGAVVVLIALVGLLHLAADVTSADRTARELAEAGAGGGWLGYAVANGLTLNLGAYAALAVLVVLALVGVSLAAGRPLRDTFAFLTRRGRDGLAALWSLRPRKIPIPARIAPSPPDARPHATAAPEPATGPASDRAGAPDGAPRGIGAASDRPGPHTPWRLPHPDEVLEPGGDEAPAADDVEGTARLLEHSLAEFGIPAKVVKIERGPTVTLFGVDPGYVEKNGERTRVRVSRIVALQNDLALALAASPIRIQAPVPGRPFVGIEVPNSAKTLVSMRGVLESDAFAQLAPKAALPIVLGRDTSGRAVAADLATMPHLLVAGATGSGKSVAMNAIICTMLMTHTPDTLRMVLVDPKRVELVQYRGLPHLVTPVVVEVENVIGILQWAVREMDRRYKTFADVGARNVAVYNQMMLERGRPALPLLVILIDELADLMMVAPEEAERLITRLAQLARATGIHLVLATQRPSVDVVTGLIKANFPSRIAFAVSSSVDSRVILDAVGAEKLLGRGDMLYMASDSSKLRRLQGCYVSDTEIDRLVRFWKDAAAAGRVADGGRPAVADRPGVQPGLFVDLDTVAPVWSNSGSRRDPLFDQAVAIIREHRTASTSFLQRKLRVGYARAARLLDELEAAGYVSPAEGNQPREVMPGPGRDETSAGGPGDGSGTEPDEPTPPDPADGDVPERPLRPWLGA